MNPTFAKLMVEGAKKEIAELERRRVIYAAMLLKQGKVPSGEKGYTINADVFLQKDRNITDPDDLISKARVVKKEDIEAEERILQHGTQGSSTKFYLLIAMQIHQFDQIIKSKKDSIKLYQPHCPVEVPEIKPEITVVPDKKENIKDSVTEQPKQKGGRFQFLTNIGNSLMAVGSYLKSGLFELFSSAKKLLFGASGNDSLKKAGDQAPPLVADIPSSQPQGLHTGGFSGSSPGVTPDKHVPPVVHTEEVTAQQLINVLTHSDHSNPLSTQLQNVQTTRKSLEIASNSEEHQKIVSSNKEELSVHP